MANLEPTKQEAACSDFLASWTWKSRQQTAVSFVEKKPRLCLGEAR